MNNARRSRTIDTAASFCFAVGLLAGLLALFSGFGHRWGLWDYRTGFAILRWAVFLGLALGGLSVLVVLFSLFMRAWRSLGLAVLAMAMGLTTAGVPWNYFDTASRAPPIHDITTDMENPPRFVAILPLRAGAPNSLDYDNTATAAQQLRAYPDLGPLTYRLPPAQVYERALQAAKDMGWEIVAAVPGEGRIEATDRTFWFGFTDDIVVRIRPDPKGSVMDVRSVSRVGVNDLGVNAKRVQTFLDKLIAGSKPQ